MRAAHRPRWSLFVGVALVLTACGSAQPTATDEPLETIPDFSVLPGEGPTGDSGALVRLVNLWAEPGAAGPDVALYAEAFTVDPPLLVDASYGEVSDFVTVPVAEFGEGPAGIIVAAGSDPIGDGRIFLGQLAAGDRVTVIAHGDVEEGVVGLAITSFWEAGIPSTGVAWPEVAADQGIVVMYPGALLSLDEEVIAIGVAMAGGGCLTDAQFGGPVESATGGNAPVYFAVGAGSARIVGAREPASDCTVPDEIGPVDVTVVAGGRIGLFPFGTDPDALEFLVLPLG